MKKILLALLACISFGYAVFSQNVGIGTNQPHPSAKLDISSTKSGLLPPRMTTGQRDSIVNPAEGLLVFNTESKCVEVYILGGWRSMYCYEPPQPLVTYLDCASAIYSPTTINPGVSYSGFILLPYYGGNGIAYPNGSPIASTGVTGLTATLQAGTLVNGDGSLVLNVTGTPSGDGVASFSVFFGGQSCEVSVLIGSSELIGNWRFVSALDSFYNWQQLIYNGIWLLDSTRTIDYMPNDYYLKLRPDLTFVRSFYDVNNGNYYADSGRYFSDNYSGIQRLRLLYSQYPDTFDYWLINVTPVSMNLNRIFGALNGNIPSDTLVISRNYFLSK